MNSLEEIRKELDLRILSPDFSDLKSLFDWFGKLEIPELEKHVGFEDKSYCRVPLIANDKYDLLLCCWKSGQEATFHGHPDQGCLVKILDGTLNEELKYNGGNSEIRHHLTGDLGYIIDKIGIHRVWNPSKENAVSLHLYAPGGYKPQFKTQDVRHKT